MIRPTAWAFVGLMLPLSALAKDGSDARDEEIFGSAAPSPAAAAPKPPGGISEANAARLVDSLQIGGRLEIRSDTGQREDQSIPKSGYGQLKQADVYFDTRPNRHLRGFLRARFTEASGTDGGQAAADNASSPTTTANPAASPCSATSCLRTDLDEAWLKWDLQDTVYATLGKQHLKWGSGHYWNPTDFTAEQVRDPLALFDRRLGTEMLKLQLPVEKEGFNYYAVLQYSDAAQVDQLGGALRAEFTFGGVGEVAFSAQTRPHAPLRLGFDISSGLGPIDVHSETAVSERQDRSFFSGGIDPATGRLPSASQHPDQWYVQSLAGLQHSWKYNADNSITIGAEYFYNQLGYDDRDLELYSLILGQSQSLYAGSHYAAAFVQLPTPGSWTESNFFLDGVRNLSDKTSVIRLTASWLLHKDAEIQGFVGECQGDYGEFCFRVPQSFQALSASPQLSPAQRQILAALPSKRTRTTGGLGVVLKF